MSSRSLPTDLRWVAAVLLIVARVGLGLDNGIGVVPPMGFNTWNAFHCGINETTIHEAVDAVVALRLDEAGYVYLNVDDCWMADARVDGKLTGDASRFPNGMGHVAQYVHDHGLLFGIYESAGTKTCAGFPGSLGHEETDAKTFAEWGVDFLKYDNCNADGIPSLDRFSKMRNALNATGRRIYYSLSQWGTEDSWMWAPAVANSWRTTQDIEPYWESIRFNFWQSQQHAERSARGAWLDPDMLEVGNGGLSHEENKSHFSLWCLVKAPLLLGMDLTTVTDDVLSIITNTALIAINQDPQSHQATCFVGCNNFADWSIFATTVTGGDTVAIVINWGDTFLTTPSFAGQTVGVVPFPGEEVYVADLWTGKPVGFGAFDFERLKTVPLPAPIAPHDCVVYAFRRSSGAGSEL